MNYYQPLENVSGNLYLGVHAGKHLEDAIYNAKKSIHVICPYISESYLKLLVQKHYEGVDVHAVVHEVKSRSPQTDSRFDDVLKSNMRFSLLSGYDWLGLKNIISSLISVEKVPIASKIIRRAKINQAAKICKIIGCVIYGLIAIGLLLLFLLRSPKFLPKRSFVIVTFIHQWPLQIIFSFVLAACLAAALFYISKALRKKAKRIPTIQLMFSSKVDFKLIPEKSDVFIHLKMVIIDEEIAFLGSLNLTYSGINSNLESCFSTTDTEAITTLLNIYYSMHDSVLYYPPQTLGEIYFGTYEYTDISLEVKRPTPAQPAETK